nr:DUF4157 domain-containing protein [Flavobacterium sp. ASV13]
MNSYVNKEQENKNKKTLNVTQKKNNNNVTSDFSSLDPAAAVQMQLQNTANNSEQVNQALQLQAMANTNSSLPIQKKDIEEEEEPLQGRFTLPIQRKGNNTGLPDNLKSGIENLSGYSMDDVKVHYNSDKPAQLQAHAYAQGTDIHIASGQEKHLPHEAWHVVQQKQGRVQPTLQMKSNVNVNDDAGLENEADTMGQLSINKDITLSNTPVLSHMPTAITRVSQLARKGKVLGGMTGVAVGALIGTLISPGLGTIIGAGIGGLIGFVCGHIYDKKNERPPVEWKLYINPKDHEEAENGDKGRMYDTDQSPGYQASMIKAYQEEVFGEILPDKIDYAEYERLHTVVTSSLQSNGINYTTTLESIRTRSSVDAGTGFPIKDWNGPNVDVASDLKDEELDGMKMVTYYRDQMPLSNVEENEKDNRSVVVFDPETNGGMYNVRYNVDEGVTFVTKILDRFYDEIGQDNISKDQQLDAIVKAIRALHVTHPFKDANGRLHVQILLNRLLKTYNFPITIMPRDFGLGAFGGAFRIEELREMVKAGFQ